MDSPCTTDRDIKLWMSFFLIAVMQFGGAHAPGFVLLLTHGSTGICRQTGLRDLPAEPIV